MPQVDRALAQLGNRAAGIREIGGSDHAFHARQRLRLSEVDVPDARVRVRASQDAAVQHRTHLDVGPIKGTPRHFVGAVMSEGPGSNYSVLIHDDFPAVGAAVPSTARTILS